MREKTTRCIFPVLFFFFFLSTTAAKALNSSTGFIHKSCGATLYPNLCYSSLAPYASAIQQNPITLAFVATANVSLPKVNEAWSIAVALRRGKGGRLGAALRDCVDLLQSAAGETERAAAEMRKLADPKAGSIAEEFFNAQAWMNGAMTNEVTCLDGFEGVEAGLARKAIFNCISEVKKYTSNALALLDALVHQGNLRRKPREPSRRDNKTGKIGQLKKNKNCSSPDLNSEKH